MGVGEETDCYGTNSNLALKSCVGICFMVVYYLQILIYTSLDTL